MAILAECPLCHKKQSVRNRKCACGSDLTAAKRAKKVRYWVTYRLTGESSAGSTWAMTRMAGLSGLKRPGLRRASARPRNMRPQAYWKRYQRSE